MSATRELLGEGVHDCSVDESVHMHALRDIVAADAMAATTILREIGKPFECAFMFPPLPQLTDRQYCGQSRRWQWNVRWRVSLFDRTRSDRRKRRMRLLA